MQILTLNVCGGKCLAETDLNSWGTMLFELIEEQGSEVVLLQELCLAQFLTLETLHNTRADPKRWYSLAWAPASTENESCKQWGKTEPPQASTQFGNAILIRGKDAITSQSKWVLPNPHRHEPRAMLCVDIQAMPRTVRVCNVHIDFHAESGVPQVRYVADLANTWADQLPVILGGDMNLRPYELGMESVYSDPLGDGKFVEVDSNDKRFFAHPCKPDHSYCRTGSGTLRNRPDLKVDYIFVSHNDFQVVDGGVIDSMSSSDHLAVTGAVALLLPANQ